MSGATIRGRHRAGGDIRENVVMCRTSPKITVSRRCVGGCTGRMSMRSIGFASLQRSAPASAAGIAAIADTHMWNARRPQRRHGAPGSRPKSASSTRRDASAEKFYYTISRKPRAETAAEVETLTWAGGYPEVGPMIPNPRHEHPAIKPPRGAIGELMGGRQSHDRHRG